MNRELEKNCAGVRMSRFPGRSWAFHYHRQGRRAAPVPAGADGGLQGVKGAVRAFRTFSLPPGGWAQIGDVDNESRELGCRCEVFLVFGTAG